MEVQVVEVVDVVVVVGWQISLPQKLNQQPSNPSFLQPSVGWLGK